jgi:amino-acid N-acetyltransferase
MSISNLRGILKYVPQFRDRVFVVTIDGEIIDSPNFSNILLDLAVLRSLNVKLVVCHGASYQVRKLARERGVVVTNTAGDGVTDDPTLELSIDAATRLNNEVMRGLTSVDLNAAYANAVIGGPMGIIQGIDYRHTGKILRVDAELLEMFVKEGIVPVIPPLGFDADGNTYRINSDAIAVRVAQDLGAVKIIFLTTTEGVYYQGDLIRQVSAAHTREMLRNRPEITPPAVRSIVEYSADACRAGIPRIHVLNGRHNEALLTEVFSSEGIGTMIYSDDYTVTRPANRRDSRRLLGLLHESGSSPEESAQAAELMRQRPENFWLLEIDENPVACLGLKLYPEERKAEIDALFVSSGHANRGYARQLLSRCEARCAEQGIHRVAIADTSLHDYFHQLEGWETGALQDLPRFRRKELKADAGERQQPILVKRLNA